MLLFNLARSLLKFNLGTNNKHCEILAVPIASETKSVPLFTYYTHSMPCRWKLVAFFDTGCMLVKDVDYVNERIASNNATTFQNEILASTRE